MSDPSPLPGLAYANGALANANVLILWHGRSLARFSKSVYYCWRVKWSSCFPAANAAQHCAKGNSLAYRDAPGGLAFEELRDEHPAVDHRDLVQRPAQQIDGIPPFNPRNKIVRFGDHLSEPIQRERFPPRIRLPHFVARDGMYGIPKAPWLAHSASARQCQQNGIMM